MRTIVNYLAIGVNISYVVKLGDTWPVFGQHGAGIWIRFGLPDDLTESTHLQSQFKTTDARK